MNKKETKKKTPPKKQGVRELLKAKAIVRIDLGAGQNKQPGWVGVDFREAPGVDIVQDLTLYPWKAIPSDCADIAMASHLLEHINPASSNPQLSALIDLLLKKKILTAQEVKEYVGEYKFLGGFIQFMDEVWRILKPGGQFMAVLPYAGSPGYWQDPTHVNPVNETTFTYFDPLVKNPVDGRIIGLYNIYRPKPWKLISVNYQTVGFMEVAMEKRLIDPSYGVTSNNGLKA